MEVPSHSIVIHIPMHARLAPPLRWPWRTTELHHVLGQIDSGENYSSEGSTPGAGRCAGSDAARRAGRRCYRKPSVRPRVLFRDRKWRRKASMERIRPGRRAGLQFVEAFQVQIDYQAVKWGQVQIDCNHARPLLECRFMKGNPKVIA